MAMMGFIEIFLIIAIIYLILTIVFSAVIDKIEKKLRIPGIGASESIRLRNA